MSENKHTNINHVISTFFSFMCSLSSAIPGLVQMPLIANKLKIIVSVETIKTTKAKYLPLRSHFSAQISPNGYFSRKTTSL